MTSKLVLLMLLTQLLTGCFEVNTLTPQASSSILNSQKNGNNNGYYFSNQFIRGDRIVGAWNNNFDENCFR